MDSRNWSNYLTCHKALSARSVIEIPGLYQQHETLFLEPKVDHHPRLLRVIEKLKPRLSYGKTISFELLLLGEDGQIYPFEVSEDPSVEYFYERNLIDGLYGSMEWILQGQNASKRCDISLHYFPQILSTSTYKMNFLCTNMFSLEELSAFDSCSELLRWKERADKLLSDNVTPSAAKRELFVEARSLMKCALCVRDFFRKRRQKFSSEYYYSLRRLFASQLGVSSLVSYFLNLPLPTPRDLMISTDSGCIPLRTAPLRVTFTEEPPFRLSPCLIEAVNSLDTCKIFIGHTALALEARQDLIQVFVLLFSLLICC